MLHKRKWAYFLITPFSACLCVAGKHDSSTDGGGGLRGVHLQGFGEQRSRRVPRHHGGVSAAAAQAAVKTEQFPQGPEASFTAPLATPSGPDWANGPGSGHEEGPG